MSVQWVATNMRKIACNLHKTVVNFGTLRLNMFHDFMLTLLIK